MPIAALNQQFRFETPPQQPGSSQQPDPHPPVPKSNPLESLVGSWEGTGFNAIWVPRRPALGSDDDRFLMLNLTVETLGVTPIPGVIPNRGFKQGDIAMTGVTYMNEISDTEQHGLHIEPGIWAVVPATTDPDVPESVVRMASIPHGTTIIAQGTAIELQNTPPRIDPVDLIPTRIIGGGQVDFPELDLSQTTPLRTANLPAAITQQVVDNPNVLLDNVVQGQTVTSMTVLKVTTTNRPVPGGGTANTAFLEGEPHPGNANADARRVEAIFWIEEIAADGDTPAFTQLQYTQTVMLDFAGLHWPHVTVANLRKVGPPPKQCPPEPEEPGYAPPAS